MANKGLLKLTLGFLVVILTLSMIACASAPAPAPSATSAPAPAPTSAPAKTTAPASTQAPTASPKPSAATQVIKLNWGDFFPSTNSNHLLQEKMAKEISDKTNGQVVFTHFPGGSLLSAPQMVDGVANGVADIGSTHTGYTPGIFPFTGIMEMPLGFPGGWVATMAGWDFWNKYKTTPLMKEWDKVHVLIWHLDGQGVEGICTSKKVITKLADLKGAVIRSSGQPANVLTALGATVRDMPQGETYDAIAKGVVDGVAGSYETMIGWKFAEVVKYSIRTSGVNPSYVFYVAMNKDKWNSLPPDVQKIFDQVTDSYETQFGKLWDQNNIDGAKQFLKRGGKLVQIQKDEQQAWIDKVAPITENYVKSLVAKGFVEKDLRDGLTYAKSRIEYWTGQQAANQIPSILDILK